MQRALALKRVYDGWCSNGAFHVRGARVDRDEHSTRCMQWSHKCTADDSVAHTGSMVAVMHNTGFDLVRSAHRMTSQKTLDLL